MAFLIPDHIIQSSQLSEKEFKIELACWMYEKAFFTLAQGAEFCTLSQLEFMRELGKRNIRWNYTSTDLHEDLENLESLNKSA